MMETVLPTSVDVTELLFRCSSSITAVVFNPTVLFILPQGSQDRILSAVLELRVPCLHGFHIAYSDSDRAGRCDGGILYCLFLMYPTVGSLLLDGRLHCLPLQLHSQEDPTYGQRHGVWKMLVFFLPLAPFNHYIIR